MNENERNPEDENLTFGLLCQNILVFSHLLLKLEGVITCYLAISVLSTRAEEFYHLRSCQYSAARATTKALREFCSLILLPESIAKNDLS